MRTHMPVSVSLPPDLFAAAEKRAAQLGFKRATYIQQLILADLRRQKTEGPSGGAGGLNLATTTFSQGSRGSDKAPGASARQGKTGAKKAAKKAVKSAPARKPAAKKKSRR